jgi:hypothetical protein
LCPGRYSLALTQNSSGPVGTDERRGRAFRTPGALLDQVQLPGSRQGLRTASRVELAVDVVDVGLDRAHADEELGGDLAVGLASGYELKDFELTLAQGFGETYGQRIGFRSVPL